LNIKQRKACKPDCNFGKPLIIQGGLLVGDECQVRLILRAFQGQKRDKPLVALLYGSLCRFLMFHSRGWFVFQASRLKGFLIGAETLGLDSFDILEGVMARATSRS
jgi:hypothetical protein